MKKKWVILGVVRWAKFWKNGCDFGMWMGKFLYNFMMNFYTIFMQFLKNEWGLRVEQMPAK